MMKRIKQRVIETTFLAALLMLFYLMMINTASGQSKQIYYGLDLAISSPDGLISFIEENRFSSDLSQLKLEIGDDSEEVEMGYRSFILNTDGRDSTTIKQNLPSITLPMHLRNEKLLAPLIKIRFNKE